jgi:DNA polymerase-3 subunit delta'
MIDFLSLVKNTNAYKIINNDKNADKLSHAYLVVCQDAVFLKEYLKVFAKIIACKNGSPCNACRTCNLVSEENFSDVQFFPIGDKGVTTEDVNILIEESFIRPIESDKKIFVISSVEPMSAVTQNKLLKTLEEPPKNVHIIIGTTSEFSLLPTLLSRVRKLEIPLLSKETLSNALKDEGDGITIANAISCCDGTIGDAVALMDDENISATINTVVEVLTEMKSSKDVLEYSVKVGALKGGVGQFLSVLSIALRDILIGLSGKEDKVINPTVYQRVKDSGFNQGSCIYALEKVTESLKRKKFNANGTMLIEWVLFQLLEGKFKWRK